MTSPDMDFIDPPGPFESVQQWEKFLQDMLAVEPRTGQIEEEIINARAVIAEKQTALQDDFSDLM